MPAGAVASQASQRNTRETDMNDDQTMDTDPKLCEYDQNWAQCPEVAWYVTPHDGVVCLEHYDYLEREGLLVSRAN
jgi:hypothetical protein